MFNNQFLTIRPTFSVIKFFQINFIINIYIKINLIFIVILKNLYIIIDS